MTTLVVDASVAIKWAVDEEGSAAALELLRSERLVAPDLWIAECANILWKKVKRGELTADEALSTVGVLADSGVALMPMARFFGEAVRLAVRLDHPAYDCFYLALAVSNGWTLVTADERLIARLARSGDAELISHCRSLAQASEALG